MDKEDTNLEIYFDECVEFIDEAKRQGGCVLVHCFVGKSRRFVVYLLSDDLWKRKTLFLVFNGKCVFFLHLCSVTVVVAYLMKKHGMTLAQALQHVKSRRPVANPNSGFIKQLQDLEKSMQGMIHFTLISCDLCGETEFLNIL